MVYLRKINLDNSTQEFTSPGLSESMDEITKKLPGGAYTTLRTYQKTGTISLEDHFRRLEESARSLGASVWINRGLLRSVLRDLAAISSFPELRFRIILDCYHVPGVLYVLAEELKIPSSSNYLNGVRVCLFEGHREQPETKSTAFIAIADHIRKGKGDESVNEILLVAADGAILEGLSSNFFGVAGGIVYTAGERVLPGITRSTVISVLQEANVPIIYQPVFTSGINSLDEAFITSTSRGVLPVVSIEGKNIGNGSVGMITRQTSEQFLRKINTQIEQL